MQKKKTWEDPTNLKAQENNRKRLSLKRLRVEDHAKVKVMQKKWQTKHRIVNSVHKRLKKFKEETMYNAIFICSCCHRKLFHSNVTKITQDFRDKIIGKKEGLLGKSIQVEYVEINGILNLYT